MAYKCLNFVLTIIWFNCSYQNSKNRCYILEFLHFRNFWNFFSRNLFSWVLRGTPPHDFNHGEKFEHIDYRFHWIFLPKIALKLILIQLKFDGHGWSLHKNGQFHTIFKIVCQFFTFRMLFYVKSDNVDHFFCHRCWWYS